MRFPYVVLLSACALTLALPLVAQSPNGVLNGLVVDPSNRAIVAAEIVAVNDVTGVQYTTKTSDEGIYVLPNLPPGPYRLQVSKIGFKTLIKPDIVLNVQDALSVNFTLPVGAFSETVTVEGGASLVNTESATVSTVIDRQFAENLPMNGRSFQTLIQLTPGVVLTQSTFSDDGQFSVNGQRAVSNYWMVDGVSANIGAGVNQLGTPGNSLAGSLGSFSAQGGTNSLVSVDAMQEFRIQTSTYAPEFGRTPGGQISIVTRSGTNQFHGTAFDYLRNDVFDANDWFADANSLPKPEERQNDFGGTVGGRIVKDRTFFFFSYEGLRLRLPRTALTTVPDLIARQNASAILRPYLNAYPLPNAVDDVLGGVAQFNASFSNLSTLDAYSLRIDHKVFDRLTIFGRYNYSPSEIVQRGAASGALSQLSPSHITTQTATVGAISTLSPVATNDLRLNWSRANAYSTYIMDNFGGAAPLTLLPFPAPYTDQDALFAMGTFSLVNGFLSLGRNGTNLQRQINVVDDVSLQRGSHSLKFGIDFRRLTPLFGNRLYVQANFFLDVPSLETGSALESLISSGRNVTLLFRNLGAFAQDTWRVKSGLTMTYGLRWDVDFAPSSVNGPNLPAVTGYNLGNFSNLALAAPGTPAFRTPYGNLAPRVGIAYQVNSHPNWQTVLRGGLGAFYDLATSEAGNLFTESYPFGAQNLVFGASFPLDSLTAAPPPITPSNLSSAVLSAFDPNLKLPYTLQWNVALEQALGSLQAVSASYIGSVGRRLIQTVDLASPNPRFGEARLVGNTATSDYDALQIQFQRRLSRGLQMLASYTWSHSIDDASAGSWGNASNTLVPSFQPNTARGASDFDTRNAFSAAMTYDIPFSNINSLTNTIFRGWSLQSVVQARSALPVDVHDSRFVGLTDGFTNIRPDVVPGIPVYLYGPQYAGGKIFNDTPNAGGPGCVGPFCSPPIDANGIPLRQGDLKRNALRGFGATQWDFAIHRDFPIHESLKLQFRAEIFNILNHPNFAAPIGDINQPQFGKSTQTLGQSLDQNSGGGSLASLYQIGGPRSIQLALKLHF